MSFSAGLQKIAARGLSTTKRMGMITRGLEQRGFKSAGNLTGKIYNKTRDRIDPHLNLPTAQRHIAVVKAISKEFPKKPK